MTVSPTTGEKDPLEAYQFPGFSSPNTTAVPDVFFDELMGHLSEAELRITLYIIRRTFGFKKRVDSISLGQFLDGITTREGRVLDYGCGVKSRGHLSKALKSLVEKGVIVAVKAQKANGSNAVSSYALRIVEGVVPQVNPPRSPSEPGVVPQVNPQETVLQQTEKQRETLSTAPLIVDKFVDNSPSSHVVILVPQIAAIMEDFSKEMNDFDHTVSNISQATRLYRESGLSLDKYFSVLYGARTKTRKATGVQNRMSYFFTVLRDEMRPT